MKEVVFVFGLIALILFSGCIQQMFTCSSGHVVPDPSLCPNGAGEAKPQTKAYCGDGNCLLGSWKGYTEDCNSCQEDCGECSPKQNEEKFCYGGKCFDEKYKQYFKENPVVFEAVTEVQGDINYLIEYIGEIETSGQITMEEPSLPSDFQCVFLTDEQKNKINAAKIAHAIWLDKNEKVPWKLKDYTEEELKTILMLTEELEGCPFISGVVDYSPSEAYNYAKPFIKDSAVDTVYAIISDLRKDFRHSVGEKEMKPTYRTLKEDLTTYVEKEEGTYRISRTGCWSMGGVIVALLRSINIPAYIDGGWYAGDAHASVFLPSIQKIINHGDDIYSSGLNKVPTEELLMPYDYFNTKIRPCGKNTSCAKSETIRYNLTNELKYPGSAYMACTDPFIISGIIYENCESCITEKIQESLRDSLTNAEVQEATQEMINKVC